MSQTDTSRKMTHILSCKRFMDLENLNKAELYFEKSNDQIIALDRQLFRLQQRYATLTNTQINANSVLDYNRLKAPFIQMITSLPIYHKYSKTCHLNSHA